MTVNNLSTDEELQRFEEKYEQILSRDPSSVTFIFLAQVLYKQGKVDKAINVLIKGLRYNKKSVTGRFLLGKIYYDRWLIEQAKREFQSVVQLAPDNLAACRMLMQIYRSEGKQQKALDILRTAYNYHPEDESIAIEIHQLEYEMRLKDKKEREFSIAKENIESSMESKTVEELLSNLGEYDTELLSETIADLYLEQGLYEKASHVLEGVLRNDPENRTVRDKLEKTKLYLINKTAGFNQGE